MLKQCEICSGKGYFERRCENEEEYKKLKCLMCNGNGMVFEDYIAEKTASKRLYFDKDK